MPKISQYPPMSTLTGAEILVGDQAGITSTATGTQLQALVQLTSSILVTLGLQATDSGAVNAYVLTSPKPPAALTTGQLVVFTPLNTNNTAVTINYNGHGAIPALGWGGGAMTGGELSSAGPALLQYTGAAWQLVSTVGAQPGNQRTAAEIAAGVTPVNYAYPPENAWRYGLNPSNTAAQNTSAWANWTLIGQQNVALYAPAGTYSINNVFWGSNTVGAQSNCAPEIYGDGAGATVFKAAAGVTGTLITAKNIAGVHLHDFTIDCNSQVCIGIDTSWFAVGPSLQNHYTDIYVQFFGSTTAGWLATNNNDCPFDKVTIRNPTGSAQIGLSLVASGGSIQLKDVYCGVGCYMLLGAQVVNMQGGFQTGIQFATGCENVVHLNSCYIYANANIGGNIATQALTAGTNIQSLTCTGCWFDMTLGSTSVIKARVGAGIIFNGCAFATGTGTIYLIDPASVPDLGTTIPVSITLNTCRRVHTANGDMNTTYPVGFVVYKNNYDSDGVMVNNTSGAYSPNFTFSGGNTGMTYTENTGRFSITNGFCYFEAECVMSAVGSSTGGCAISLPVACNAGNPGRGFLTMLENFTFSGSPVSLLPAGGTGIGIYEQVSAGPAVQLTNSALAGGGPWKIRVQGFYAT